MACLVGPWACRNDVARYQDDAAGCRNELSDGIVREPRPGALQQGHRDL